MVTVWSSAGQFRMPDGVRIVGEGTDSVRIQVSMPTDEHGFFGRQCPSCSQLFRVDSDDYEALPDEVELWCVYCGHHDEHSEFITAQQLDRAERAVTDWAEQSIGQMLDRSLGRLGTPRPRSGFGIQVSYRSTRFTHSRCPA
jgi:Zn ribbon nucleic-acid-binding protein